MKHLHIVVWVVFSVACSSKQGSDINEATLASTNPSLKTDLSNTHAAPSAKQSGLVATLRAEIGKEAPDFSLRDTNGNQVQLSAFRGKDVVLEWFNPSCPFVKYAYNDGPMKSLVREELNQGTVWLAINSGAPGKQGHGLETNQKAVADWGMEQPVLLDEQGSVGRAYGAKSTPHMFVINKEGVLVYRGALDTSPLGKTEGEAKNFVTDTLLALRNKQPVPTAETRSYGCSVKYN